MSERSGYTDDGDEWSLIRWRGAVAAGIRGKRGQAFLREMLAALDALPEKRLIADDLERDGEVCALGSVGKVRGMDMSKVDLEDHECVAEAFGLPHAMTCEIMHINDESGKSPEDRYEKVRAWIEKQLIEWETP